MSCPRSLAAIPFSTRIATLYNSEVVPRNTPKPPTHPGRQADKGREKNRKRGPFVYFFHNVPPAPPINHPNTLVNCCFEFFLYVVFIFLWLSSLCRSRFGGSGGNGERFFCRVVNSDTGEVTQCHTNCTIEIFLRKTDRTEYRET